MEDLLSDYLQIEDMIKHNRNLAASIENLFMEDSNVAVTIEDIVKHLPYPSYLLRSWSNINSRLESIGSSTYPLASVEINDRHFYGCLYASIMMQDERIPEESPALISLITCLQVGMHRNAEEFTKEECLKVLLAGLKKIHTRDLMDWDASSEFLFGCLQAVKTMTMDTVLLNSIINMLMIYAAKHFNMVNSLSLADRNSPCGVLAFACLANLFIKKCKNQQVIMETMLENIEYAMENNAGLNVFQVSVKQSNFQQMIRQVGTALTSCADHMLFALLRVAERHPKSKSLVFIVNQLPFALFCQFANVVVRLCNRQYYQPMQMFSFNMLESPYITEEEDESCTLQRVYCHIAESIIWPLQKFEQLPVTETIKLVYAMLQVQNIMVQDIIRKMTQTVPIMQELMTYINQYCNSSWKHEYRMMNQYYIAVYCQLLILNSETVHDLQFRQFTSLLLHASSQDLNPCLKDVKALIGSATWRIKEVQSAVINALVKITTLNQTSTHSISFLRMLHEIIFNDLRVGIDCYHIITLKSPQCDLVLKNMVKHRLVTARDIESLSILCKHLQGWRLMSDLSIHMDVPLSKHILYFAEHLHQLRNSILNDFTLHHVVRFFCEVLDRKAKACAQLDKETLMRFAVFLEGSLINRSVPVDALPLALLTVRKYHTYFSTPLARLQAMHEDVERKTCEAFRRMLHDRSALDAIPILARDVAYFAEVHIIYGDLEAFQLRRRTRDLIEEGMRHMQDITTEFSPLALAMLQCAAKVAVRQDDLLAPCVRMLSTLITHDQARLSAICMDSLYDVALFRTASYEMLVPHVYDLLTTRNPLHAVTALHTYMKLLAKEHTIPNDWQTFVLALAVGNEEVVKFIDPHVLEAFMEKLTPYFETYFVHILFYCNDICDDEEHLLLPEFRERILTEKLCQARRHRIYCMLIKYFRSECRTKILHYMYKKIVQEYLSQNSTNSMTEDILIVTYEAFKCGEYPELNQLRYEKTLDKIKKLENYTSKKIGNGINADEILILIITKLTKFLYNISDAANQLIPKLFHVILAIIDWNYSSIFNAIVDEGMNGKLRKCILKLSEAYRDQSHLFQFIDVLPAIDFHAHPIQSNCNRV